MLMVHWGYFQLPAERAFRLQQCVVVVQSYKYSDNRSCPMLPVQAAFEIRSGCIGPAAGHGLQAIGPAITYTRSIPSIFVFFWRCERIVETRTVCELERVKTEDKAEDKSL